MRGGTKSEKGVVGVDAQVLKNISFFSALSDEDLTVLAARAAEASVGEGREIVREGDYSYDFFVIQDGKAAVLQDGKEIAELGQGEVFGEAGVMERSLRNATVVSKTPMRLITFTHWDLDHLRRQIPEVVERLEKAFAEHQPDAASG
jgi:CRP/FNR family cyclic AMP-dependent transcriptional regulator